MTKSAKWPPLPLAVLLSLAVLTAGCGARHASKDPHLSTRAARLNVEGTRAAGSGEMDRAEALLREALALNRSIDNRAGELVNLINLSRVLIAAGDYDSPVPLLEQAASLSDRTRDRRSLSEVYATLAKAHYLAGRRAAALDYVERAVDLDRSGGFKTLGSRLNIKARIYMDEGREEDALSMLREAVEINRKNGSGLELANSYRALAGLLSSQKGEDALNLYRKAYEIDRTLGSPRKIAVDLRGMAVEELKGGRLEEAAFLFERAYTVCINASMKEEAVLNLDSVISVYDELGDGDMARRFAELRERISKGGSESSNMWDDREGRPGGRPGGGAR